MRTLTTFRIRHRHVTILLLLAPFTTACASARPAESDEDRVRVGYGTQDRGDLTASVASVTAEDMEGRQVTSLEDLINGRVAGVTVRRLNNGGISIRIRGASSLMGGGEPLYVIDGLPINASPGTALAGLNPKDITRIDILKDTGATAIYGSRGANGVVLVTTKRAN